MRTATVPLRGGRVANMEVFSSMAEACTVLKGRKPVYPEIDHDYVHGTAVHRPEWSGFGSPEELQRNIRAGISDPTFASKVQRCKSDLSSEIAKLREVKRDVAGGNVVVPLFVQGVPECMTRVVHKKVKSKVVHMVIDSTVAWTIDACDLQDVATAAAIAIASLEKSGYRVQVDLIATAVCSGRGKSATLSCMVPMKRAEEALNISKLLFMVASPSFFRGFIFNWMTTNPRFPCDSGLGYSLATHVGEAAAQEALRELARAVGIDKCAALVIQPLCELYTGMKAGRTRDEAIQKMTKHILGMVKTQGM